MFHTVIKYFAYHSLDVHYYFEDIIDRGRNRDLIIAENMHSGERSSVIHESKHE